MMRIISGGFSACVRAHMLFGSATDVKSPNPCAHSVAIELIVFILQRFIFKAGHDLASQFSLIDAVTFDTAEHSSRVWQELAHPRLVIFLTSSNCRR